MSKIIKCKTCGNEIAANAKACPNCGAKNKKPIFKKPIFWILIIALVVGVVSLFGSGSEPAAEIDYSKPDFVVTADEIMSEFTQNSVSAQEKYGDKIVQVTGKIGTISEYSIYLSGDDDENWLTNVVLSLASGQDDIIRSISKGKEITAVGKFEKTDVFDDIKLKYAKIDATGIEIKPTESQATEDEVIEVDIDELIEAYENNSVAADGKYKDRTVKLTGKIVSIEEGYIKLEGTDEWDWTYIYAYYNYEEDVTGLKKGQKITVTGVCKGEDLFSDIEIKKCTIDK